MQKILIIEAYSAANVGSGALVENSVRLLQENFSDSSIEILAQSPPSIKELTGLPVFNELLTLPLGKSRPIQVLWLVRTFIWMFFHIFFTLLSRLGITVAEHLYTYNRNTLTALRKIKESDIVVSVGAERINDNFYKAILFSLYMLMVAKGYKKFLVLFPQTIGPFHFSFTRWLSAKVLDRCDVVFLRDQRSLDTVKKLDVDDPKVIRTCDVAVIQPAVSKKQASELLKKAGAPLGEKPILGISAMQWTYIKAEGKSGYAEYCAAIAKTADAIIEKEGVFVTFIATNILSQGCREDDVAAAQDIIAKMKNKDSTVILDKVYSPAELKGMMGLMEMCLVTRMHACIFCTGIHTPTVSINYQFKLKEYMEQMGLGDYTIDIDVVTPEALSKLVFSAWEKRPELRGALEKSVKYWGDNLRKEMAGLPELYNEWRHD